MADCQVLTRPGFVQTDEEWDRSNSYENLLMLSARLGDALPQKVPPHVIASLPTCLYSKWQGGSCQSPPTPPLVGKGKQKVDEKVVPADSKDTNCPICLEEYKSLDMVMSVPGCNHAFHETCLTVSIAD